MANNEIMQLLVKELYADPQAAAQQDPYHDIGTRLLQMQTPHLAGGMSSFGAGAAGFLKGLLGGGARSYARNQAQGAQDQKEAAIQAAMQAMQSGQASSFGQALGGVEGIDPRLVNIIKMQEMITGQNAAAESAAKEADFKLRNKYDILKKEEYEKLESRYNPKPSETGGLDGPAFPVGQQEAAIPEIMDTFGVDRKKAESVVKSTGRQFQRFVDMQRIQGIDQREKKRADLKKRERQVANFVVPDYLDESKLPSISATEAADLRAMDRANSTMISVLDRFSKKPDSAFFSILGNEPKELAALSGLFMNAGRFRTKSGANFTKTEQEMIAVLKPASLRGSNEFMTALKDYALRVKPSQFSRDMKGFLKKSMADEVFAMTGQAPPGAKWGDFSDDLRERWQHAYIGEPLADTGGPSSKGAAFLGDDAAGRAALKARFDKDLGR